MPNGTVTVTSPAGHDVYINGNYAEPDPPTIPCTLLVEYGDNLLETVTLSRRVDFRGTATVNEANPNVTIALAPVVPSERL